MIAIIGLILGLMNWSLEKILKIVAVLGISFGLLFVNPILGILGIIGCILYRVASL